MACPPMRKATKAAVDAMRKKGLEQGSPSALGTFFVVASVPSMVTREMAEPLAEPLTVQTPEGAVVLENTVLTYPTRVRSHIRRVITEHAPQLAGERCDQQCVNEAINELTKPITGGALFEAPGRLNKGAVASLLEKGYVAPETDLFGTPAAAYFVAFQPTIRAYAAVQKAASEADGDLADAGKKLWSLKSRKEVAQFYSDFATEAKIAETTGLDPAVARSIAGWWIRRYADETAPLFVDFLGKVIKAYDPEQAPKL